MQEVHVYAIMLINKIKYADIFHEITQAVLKNEKIRVDAQGSMAVPGSKYRKYNIQVQVNSIKGMSTVTHILIDGSIMVDDERHKLGVARKVRGALFESFYTGYTFSVVGVK